MDIQRVEIKIVVRNDWASEPYEVQITVHLSQGRPLYFAQLIDNYNDLPTVEKLFKGFVFTKESK